MAEKELPAKVAQLPATQSTKSIAEILNLNSGSTASRSLLLESKPISLFPNVTHARLYTYMCPRYEPPLNTPELKPWDGKSSKSAIEQYIEKDRGGLPANVADTFEYRLARSVQEASTMAATDLAVAKVAGVGISALSKTGFGKDIIGYFEKSLRVFPEKLNKPMPVSVGVIPSKNSGVVVESIATQRRRFAFDFYKRNGMPEHMIDGHLDGIDFNRPVNVVQLDSGVNLQQFQIPGGNQGSYYSFPVDNASPTSLGISGNGIDKSTGALVGKVQLNYVTTQSIEVLQSTAKPIVDNWSVPGAAIQTMGGSPQIYVPRGSTPSIILK